MRPLSFAWHVATSGLARFASTDVACANALGSANELAAVRREREEISALLAARALPDVS
ncbi:hypothetical protein KV102_12845 [Mumia sp. zg.B53]|uniref:hypothetical protein n=1 Tax=unclassified Mumia TaxID=2621872 RepID=UPI001C6F592D|nr:MULTISPECIES: hypothetical protein [unclassified Mumia]MBW9206550.1 hypothetical protein [Mumia sp. zg.B17]MBW9211161.1 hypothetical protein [Mumia sp. zg.B21]MBW9215727.1 hypothetical protein [Mumia sp. zg.B53]MDD9348138.1 hypothetical protein [Mumia sp.]